MLTSLLNEIDGVEELKGVVIVGATISQQRLIQHC